jgi:hypothetical protein
MKWKKWHFTKVKNSQKGKKQKNSYLLTAAKGRKEIPFRGFPHGAGTP